MGFLYCLNPSAIRHQHLLMVSKIQLTTEQNTFLQLLTNWSLIQIDLILKK